MKTALQLFINDIGNMAQGLDAEELYNYCIKIFPNYLLKEKEQINEAVAYGFNDATKPLEMMDKKFEDYYNNKYKQ